MTHQDIWNNGVKVVSATTLPSIIGKDFLDKWRIKLCQCKTHTGTNKSDFKDVELAILNQFGVGHCGYVYADQVKDDAADLGNEVHKLMEVWLKTGNIGEASSSALMWADKIIEIYKQNNVKPYLILPEATLVDYESNLSGSPDFVNEWNGEPEIDDFKIKNQLDKLTGMQGMAYRYLIRRKFNKDIRWMRVLWCQKENVGKQVKPILIDLDEWEKPWKSLVDVWNVLHPKRKVTLF